MTAKLTDADPHHWHPNPKILEWLSAQIPTSAKVLEIGPGDLPFARATHFVDFVDRDIAAGPTCDLSCEPLPFPDKSFDFIYCRHVLEDMYNPFLLCREMERVGRAGYIETPSPIAEMCRGVDGGSPYYRGYHHHRYMVWKHFNDLCFLAKYPIVEYIPIVGYLALDEQSIVARLRSNSRYWNTYCMWSDRINVRHIQNTLDYDLPRDYPRVVHEAMQQSAASIDHLWRTLSAAEIAA